MAAPMYIDTGPPGCPPGYCVLLTSRANVWACAMSKGQSKDGVAEEDQVDDILVTGEALKTVSIA